MKFRLPQERSSRIIESFDGLHIGVLGDVMLDRYIRGSARRLSPEAPVPVVEIEEETEHPGGAANVAVNLRSLGVEVSMIGMIGQDQGGERLVEILNGEGVASSGLISSLATQTTVKTRVIADGQHIVRADREIVSNPSVVVRKAMVDYLGTLIPTLDALILQDYNKGTVSREVIESTIDLARRQGIPVYVDPKRDNFFRFREVTLFKPNRQELENATGVAINTIDDALDAADSTRKRLGASHLVLTLGSEGMILVSEGSNPYHVETRAIQVADVSGAGDTVISLLAAAGAAGATPLESVVLANAGAGIVCGRVGTVSVTTTELRRILGDLEGETPLILAKPGSDAE